MEWLGSEGAVGAVAIFTPGIRLWPVGKPFLLLTCILDSSFGSVDAFPNLCQMQFLKIVYFYFTYQAAPGLGCGRECGIQFPDQGLNQVRCIGCAVLATGPQGKSWCSVIPWSTWKFSYLSSPFSRLNTKQYLVLLRVVQTRIAGEMLIIPFLHEYFPIIYLRYL